MDVLHREDDGATSRESLEYAAHRDDDAGLQGTGLELRVPNAPRSTPSRCASAI